MYCVVSREYISETNKKITMYGIKSDNLEFDCISENKTSIEELCRKCNECMLSEIHIREVIEDFIDETAFGIHGEKHL